VAPLTLAVHELALPDLSDADAAARRRTTAGRLKMLAVLAVCAAPVVASYLAYYVLRPEGRTNYGTLIQPSRALPDLPLVDLDGRSVPAKSLHGQWLLLIAGPADCDTACEKRLYAQRQLRAMLGRERDRLDRVWLVTDEAPLRPELRAALAAEPAVTVLRAPRAAVAAWLAPDPGAGALDEHFYVVDPLGEWMMRLPVTGDPSKIKRDLEKLLRASAGWDRPGR
jgi:cytochrome oxidase Cu insertion factor (SCO1/SenC/PrrC family)